MCVVQDENRKREALILWVLLFEKKMEMFDVMVFD